LALLHQGFYYAAAREFKRLFSAPENSGDIILQADAAGRAALVYLEIGDFDEALRWAHRSIAKCSQCIGLPVREILRAASRYSADPSQSASVLACRILSDTLHNRCQILLRQMLYCSHEQLEQPACMALQTSLALDQRLDLSQPAGNDLRCRAVLEIIGRSPDRQSALRLIDECKGNFARGGLFEAHLVKTQGIVFLQSGKPVEGIRRLRKSEEMLSSFPDARGLAFAWYLLSDAILRTSENRPEALHYLLSAAALHPYGVAIDRCRRQARYANRRDLQAEIDDLIAGKGQYSAVHRMTDWMAEDSPHTAEDLLFRNIHLMTAGNFPQVEIQDRPAVNLETI
jgi:tetratricopeptide (TPR) repeat protein